VIQFIRVFFGSVLPMLRSARRHVRMPAICGFANPHHDFLNLWSSCFVTEPTLLDEFPQGVGDPDGFCIRRFIRAKARRDVICELWGSHVWKRLLSCQDLTERQKGQADGDTTIRLPEV